MHLELQAANFAQMTEQMPLALEYASRAISEASAFIEEALNRPPRSIPDETVRLASLYAVAFIPWVWRHPGIQTGALANDAEWQGLTFLLQHVRPSLDQAGWAHWEFPADLAAKARHAGARALTDYGRMSMRGARSGEDIRSAQTLGEEALVLVQDLPPDQLTADAHNLLARCFFAYDDLDALRDQAIPHMEKSIKILEGVGNVADAALDRDNLANAWLKLTEFAAWNGVQTEVESRFAAAERLYRQNVGTDAKPGPLRKAPSPWVGLGALYLERRLLPEAEDCFRRGQAAAHATGEISKERTAAADLGECLLRQAKPEEAEKVLRPIVEAIEANDPSGVDAETIVLTYGKFGDVLRRQGRMKEARRWLDTATERIDKQQSSFFYERSRLATVKSFRWAFEASIDCLASLDGASVALERAEFLKWRLLGSILRVRRLPRPANVPVADLQREQALLDGIQRVVLGTPGSAGEIDPAVTAELEAIWNGIAALAPDYVAIRRDSPVSAKELAERLDQETPVLVDFYVGDELDVAWAFVLRLGETAPIAVPLKAPLRDVEAEVALLRAATDEHPVEQFNAAARKLYDRLWKPLASLIPENAGVCIVPSGPLHNVPFGALFDGEKYLIERNAFTIAPSASALRLCLRKDRTEANRCLLFAATSGISDGQKSLPDLELFEELARTRLAPLFAQSRLIGPAEATRQRLLQEVAQGVGDGFWDVLHIAGHGEFKERVQTEARLLLRGATADPERDLTEVDLFAKIEAPAALVTLSACDTGMAGVRTGDDLFGLAHGFLAAGASSVLASLWYVRQGVGVEVSRRFYELWKGAPGKPGIGKAAALRAAQSEALRKKVWFGLGRPYAHPYQWAAFQLYGDWH